jgi:predicted methyltransferase
MKLAALAIAACLLTATPLAAAPANVAQALASPDRPESARKQDATRKSAELLAFAGLETGDRVLDVMAGGGYYAELIGKAVGPRGSVVALLPPGYLEGDGRKNWDALMVRTPNVRLQPGTMKDVRLAPASFDLALFNLTYHDLYWESVEYKFPRLEPADFLSGLFAAMKPGGAVVVVDHVAKAGGDPRVDADKLHRIDPAIIEADFARAGFLLEARSDLFRSDADDITKLVFDPAVRGKTDKVTFRFVKPAAGSLPVRRPSAGRCDAAKGQFAVGQPYTPELAERARTETGARTLRAIRPGQPVTMDYRQDRLNIEYEPGGNVTRVTCG